jgi:hypothetical protein
MAPRRKCSGRPGLPRSPRGHPNVVAQKTDYSPVEKPAGEAEKRRQRRKFWAIFGGAHIFWLYAVVIAGVVLLVIWLLGGFGEGAEGGLR